MGRNRFAVLELAVLGLLHRTPMHGYELRKQLTNVLGMFRALSYGSLYPCLHELLAAGLIAEEHDEAETAESGGPARLNGPARPRSGRRSLKVYRLTADGKERLQELLGEGGPAAWDDDGFGVHFAFFGQTRADVRLRILEGRRSRARGTDGIHPGGPHANQGARGQLHPGTAPAWPGVSRTGSPVAERADRFGAAGRFGAACRRTSKPFR